MKEYIVVFLFLLSQTFYAQSFQQLISYINALPENERQPKVDSFMNATNHYPLTESDTLCNFIYKGAAQSVSVAGDFTGWKAELSMHTIAGTDFWYFNAHFESDARLEYKYVINGSKWILDPLNPNTCTGGFGKNSEFRMPSYVVPPEIIYYSKIPHGIIKDTIFHSRTLGNDRTVRIYLPPGYNIRKKYPVILFHDGLEFISLANANNILDWLISLHQIESVIGIFVPPTDREEEFAGKKKDAYTEFISGELMPVIDRIYSVSSDAHERAAIGISNGGNISLFIAMKHPETFGKVAALSSNIEAEISSTFQNEKRLDLELYIDMGKYDIPALIPLFNDFLRILQDKKYKYTAKTWHEGHSWCNWSGHLSYVLMQFFPADTQVK